MVFTVALAVRLVHTLQLRAAPLFPLKLGDSGFFDSWARELAAGDWVGREVFWYAPLYPYFMGVVYRLLGDDPLVLRSIQAAIGATSCVLLYAAGRRLLGPREGGVAGLLLALYAPAIFYDGLLHKPVLATAFLCLMLWLLAILLDRPNAGRLWFGLGLASGGLTLLIENAAIFVAVFLGWIAWARHAIPVQRARAALLLLAGLTAVLLPVATRNRVVGGEFHLTAANFGDNFFKGNNPQATGGYMALRPGRGSPQYERQDATELAEVALGRSLTPSEVSRYWTGRAIDWIAAEPLDWLRLEARKFALLCNALEWADGEDPYTHAESSLPLRLLLPISHLGVLLPVATLALWLDAHRRRRLALVTSMLVAFSASVLVFYVFGRYRFPMVPLLILLAAAGATHTIASWRGWSASRRASSLLVALAVAAFCNWPIYSRAETRSGTEVNIGAELLKAGDDAGAERHLRRAVELAPTSAKAHYNLGMVLGRLGRAREAMEAYRQALSVQPDYSHAHTNLGVALAASGRLDEAAEHFRQALHHDAQSVTAMVNLSALHARRGEFGEAVRFARLAAARTRHRDLAVLERLELSLAAAGDPREALVVAERALAQVAGTGDERRAEALRQRIARYRQSGTAPEGGGIAR